MHERGPDRAKLSSRARPRRSGQSIFHRHHWARPGGPCQPAAHHGLPDQVRQWRIV